MKRFIVSAFSIIFIALLLGKEVDAKFACVPFISHPDAHCEDVKNNAPPVPLFDNMKDCLNGGPTPNPASACTNDPRYQLRNFAPFLNFPNIGSILNLSTALVSTAGGLFCMILMFNGVFHYLNAGGDAKKIEKARSTMVFAGIGLLIVLFAYTIVRVILDITNTNTIGF